MFSILIPLWLQSDWNLKACMVIKRSEQTTISPRVNDSVYFLGLQSLDIYTDRARLYYWAVTVHYAFFQELSFLVSHLIADVSATVKLKRLLSSGYSQIGV